MIEAIISIGAALVFFKLFLFWLWLWQLKEYHAGRFMAHFQEGQAFKKIISSLWRLKYPKFTKKITVIFFTGVFLALFIIVQGYYLSVFFLIILVPLFFQIPTLFWRNIYIEKAGRKRMQFSNLLVIGITGSYGKTTTKEFLAHILSKKFKVLKTKEHQNSEVGVSNCILQELGPEHQVFVCEMGAYNRGGIKLLVDIVKPNIGIVTGVNEQHLATFGSMENLLSAEGGRELIEALPKDGAVVINQNSKFKIQNDNAKCKIITPPIPRAKVEKHGIAFEIEGVSFKVPVCGGYNVENLTLAVAVSRELGMSLEEIAASCKNIMPDSGALKVMQGVGGITVIDSTYSANPDGVIVSLDYLKLWEGKKVLVMPCLIELGQTSREVHKAIGKKIGEVCDLAIITTRDRFEDIKEGAGEGRRILFLENSKEIADTIKRTASSNDVVLLEGRVPQALVSYLL